MIIFGLPFPAPNIMQQQCTNYICHIFPSYVIPKAYSITKIHPQNNNKLSQTKDLLHIKTKTVALAIAIIAADDTDLVDPCYDTPN